jgi:hypothetical protein
LELKVDGFMAVGLLAVGIHRQKATLKCQDTTEYLRCTISVYVEFIEAEKQQGIYIIVFSRPFAVPTWLRATIHRKHDWSAICNSFAWR